MADERKDVNGKNWSIFDRILIVLSVDGVDRDNVFLALVLDRERAGEPWMCVHGSPMHRLTTCGSNTRLRSEI